jgi:hypothetical protein
MRIYLDVEVVLCIRDACEDRRGDNAVDKAAGYGSVGEARREHRVVCFVVRGWVCIIEAFLRTRIERVRFADGIMR